MLDYEFLLTQGLRFCFEVRHPFRGLEGLVMEVQAIAESDGTMDVIRGGPGITADNVPVGIIQRIKKAHGVAKDILKTKAGLSDVYFCYTPSQIMFAALLEADEEVGLWYLSLKIPDAATLEKLRTVLGECRRIMAAVKMENETEEEVKELKGLAAKLKKCQKLMAGVSVQARGKRDGEVDEERIAKKRKLERESLKNTGDELFGPKIKEKDEVMSMNEG